MCHLSCILLRTFLPNSETKYTKLGCENSWKCTRLEFWLFCLKFRTHSHFSSCYDTHFLSDYLTDLNLYVNKNNFVKQLPPNSQHLDHVVSWPKSLFGCGCAIIKALYPKFMRLLILRDLKSPTWWSGALTSKRILAHFSESDNRFQTLAQLVDAMRTDDQGHEFKPHWVGHDLTIDIFRECGNLICQIIWPMHQIILKKPYCNLWEQSPKVDNSMVTRDTPYLTADVFLDVVVKRNFNYFLWFYICSMWRVTIDI